MSKKKRKDVAIFHFSEESEGSLEMLNSIYAIQAFRDSNNPLKNYREVFKHFVQLKDGKYYSLVKNGIYLFFILWHFRKEEECVWNWTGKAINCPF